MKRFSWSDIPKDLIDEAEILIRFALKDPDLNFMITGGTCLGLARDTCLSTTTKVLYDFNWLSDRGLLAYLNFAVFHPACWALCRLPDTGESPGALLEDVPWSYPKVIMQEELQKTDEANLYIEGWNLPFGDC